MLQTTLPLHPVHRPLVLRERIQPIHVRVSRQRLIIAADHLAGRRGAQGTVRGSSSEAAREAVQVGFELGLHGLHDGDAGADDAEIGFEGRPDDVEGADAADVALSGIVDGLDAEGGEDAGARKGRGVLVAYSGRGCREGWV